MIKAALEEEDSTGVMQDKLGDVAGSEMFVGTAAVLEAKGNYKPVLWLF